MYLSTQLLKMVRLKAPMDAIVGRGADLWGAYDSDGETKGSSKDTGSGVDDSDKSAKEASADQAANELEVALKNEIDTEKTISKLIWIEAFRKILNQAFNIIGIDSPESM